MEHKGINITVTDGGLFTAIVHGVRVSAPSLASLKKKIGGDGKFEPFNAFIGPYYRGEGDPRTVVVVGIKVPRANQRRAHSEWKLANGDTTPFVYVDTEENRAAFKAYQEIRRANMKRLADLKQELDAQEELARKKIERRQP